MVGSFGSKVELTQGHHSRPRVAARLRLPGRPETRDGGSTRGGLVPLL